MGVWQDKTDVPSMCDELQTFLWDWLKRDVAPDVEGEYFVLVNKLVADFDEDDDVDVQDLEGLASAWLTGLGDPAYDNLYDISDTKDEFINLLDFSVLAAEWLSGTIP